MERNRSGLGAGAMMRSSAHALLKPRKVAKGFYLEGRVGSQIGVDRY
jgi:hypothetical protein